MPLTSAAAQAAADAPPTPPEEFLAFRPDLVFAGRYATRPAVSVLTRLGFHVVEVDAPRDDVKAEIRCVAEALERRLSRPSAERLPRRRAAMLRPNGFTAGRCSLTDELMRRRGCVNVAAELKLDNYAQLPLETIIISKVDLLVDAAGARPR